MEVLGREAKRMVCDPDFRDAVALLIEARKRGDMPMPTVIVKGREIRLAEGWD